MKPAVRCLAMAAMLCLALGMGCRAQQPLVTSLEAGETGWFRFPTRDVEGFQELFAGAKEYNGSSLGALYLPPGADAGHRAAVMVILHGSGGEWSGRGRDQAEFLVQHGVGAFVVDTFSGRGLTRDDKYVPRLMRVNIPDQLTDAFAALELLHTHPFVDSERIGVMGYSMGGTTAMLAAVEQTARAASRTDHRFALHVPMYAPCIIQTEAMATTGAPIVPLWGEQDKATPRPRCEAMVAALRAGGSTVEPQWFPDAAHGWNGHEPLQYYEDIPNFAPCSYVISADGSVREQVAGTVSFTDSEMIENAEHCVSWGYTLGRHEQTLRAANEALLDAIETYMGAPGAP